MRLAGTIALALAIAGMTLLPVGRVSANGPHQEVFAGPVGPYGLTVAATSMAGNVHVMILVLPLDSAELVSDARVEVSARGPAGGSRGVAPVLADLGSLTLWYGATLPIEESGEWLVTLKVGSSLGNAALDFPLNVHKTGGINWILLAVPAAIISATGVVVWRWAAGRSRQGNVGA